MFALIENGAFIKWIDLAVDFPNTSFPYPIMQEYLPSSVVMVETDAAPEVPQFTVFYRDSAPVFKDGRWVLCYSTRDMTEEERAKEVAERAASVRHERDNRLAGSDWTQLQDAPVDSQLWADYRQKLRDITAQEGFPLFVKWPKRPL